MATHSKAIRAKLGSALRLGGPRALRHTTTPNSASHQQAVLAADLPPLVEVGAWPLARLRLRVGRRSRGGDLLAAVAVEWWSSSIDHKSSTRMFSMRALLCVWFWAGT